MYLKELALIDLGNPTWLDGNPRAVNFAKSQLMARCLIEMLKRKLYGFQFVPNAKLDEQLLSVRLNAILVQSRHSYHHTGAR